MTRPVDLRAKLSALAALGIGALMMAGQPAAAMEEGEIFLTQGLVCDRPSFVDAVVTLASSGEDLPGAMAQVNAGAEKPRCVAGTLLVAKYVAKARTFFTKDNAVHVHKVKVVGFAMATPDGVVPQRLPQPITQYVFSMEKAAGA
ncbi:MAG: hypothetical protein KJZ80_16220 [Hyphomicrobiaceae bacterium]|nr:hypothetical protein [Hyphomicrobiaceae bacterium]